MSRNAWFFAGGEGQALEYNSELPEDSLVSDGSV